jgi:hypothetical protein
MKRMNQLLVLIACCTLAPLAAPATTNYVWQGSPFPTPPYTNWAKAAHTIQEAVDTAQTGDTVLVTNGVYSSGGRPVGPGMLTNRVVVAKPLILQSLFGPGVTFIVGASDPGGGIGDGATRCVYLTNGAILSGFTLTNGFTRGQYDPNANYCGGGASASSLTNCTLTGNSAYWSGGGAHGSTLNNCILYYNSATSDPNHSGATLLYSCTVPLPASGIGNTTNAPQFVDRFAGNRRLQSNSPCINAGNSASVSGTTDLDGRPRIVGGTVDMGAYEYQGPSMSEFIGWLLHYALPADGSADFADSDGDHLSNWQEWCCRTDPTNSLSVLALLPPSFADTNVQVTWQSVAGVKYHLERSSNLSASPSFTMLATNLIGEPDTTAFTDTNAVGGRSHFYRVGVQGM